MFSHSAKRVAPKEKPYLAKYCPLEENFQIYLEENLQIYLSFLSTAVNERGWFGYISMYIYLKYGSSLKIKYQRNIMLWLHKVHYDFFLKYARNLCIIALKRKNDRPLILQAKPLHSWPGCGGLFQLHQIT